jgi:hypothetical protein
MPSSVRAPPGSSGHKTRPPGTSSRTMSGHRSRDATKVIDALTPAELSPLASDPSRSATSPCMRGGAKLLHAFHDTTGPWPHTWTGHSEFYKNTCTGKVLGRASRMGYLTFPHLADFDSSHGNYGPDTHPNWWDTPARLVDR